MPLFSRRLLVTFEKSCDAGLRMRLFKRRPIVTIEDFCESFYDSEIFPSRSVSTWQYLLKFSLNRFNHDMVELDQSFSQVDMDALSREMVAIVMEVFGFQRLPILMFHLELGIRQLRFTESYLYQKDRKDIWETKNR